MLVLLFAGVVQASDVEGPERPVPPAEEAGAARDDDAPQLGGGGSSGSKKKKKNKDSDNETSFKKGKFLGWNFRPYVSPGGGLTISDGGTAITGGVDVGARYWKDKWKGDLSAGGSYTTGALLNGYDIHAGNEFGRREKWWGLSAGLIGFYNGYISEDGKSELDPSVGLDIPVEVVLGPKKYYLWGGVTPSFLFNETRHVESLPFGDELEWGVGAGLKLKWITAEAGFTSRITTVGVINTPVISVSISGLD